MPWWFYHRYLHELLGEVTLQDAIQGHSFVCYANILDDQPLLLIETNRLRGFYGISGGCLVQVRYIGAARFLFRIPIVHEAEDALPTDGEVDDA